jgi:uncharacterized membrane protein YbaN (DUF454 family)
VGNATNLSDKIKRGIFTMLGTVFLVIGAIGIVLPVLPTTPLLLLAAACYIRGSPRLYHWMLHNRVFGEFLRNYRAGRGITLRHKLTALALLWGAIGYSVVRGVRGRSCGGAEPPRAHRHRRQRPPRPPSYVSADAGMTRPPRVYPAFSRAEVRDRQIANGEQRVPASRRLA